ncbi:NAD(P)/FAD-dependent oxidoreductase [Massilia sp. TWR1-2-2]|uniref:NAD(P)/FAD-dependent oxidoreductase n=1 Tax=Massilia sp. TWR1-2-2 TaxID=2804584 RepID=UPI003CF494D7
MHVVIRGDGLAASMSNYLVERIAALPNIVVHAHTEITGLEGDEHGVARVHWRNRDSGADQSHQIGWVFLFIGADPHTGWLADYGVGLDEKAFIRSGELISCCRVHPFPFPRCCLDGRAARQCNRVTEDRMIRLNRKNGWYCKTSLRC